MIQTFQAAAELGNQSLGAYVISMAKRTSDVLAVELLQKEAHMTMAGPRFVSSKSNGIKTAYPMSPAAAQANAAAPTVTGGVSAPFAVPQSVNSKPSGEGLGPDTADVKQPIPEQSKDAGRRLVSVCKCTFAVPNSVNSKISGEGFDTVDVKQPVEQSKHAGRRHVSKEKEMSKLVGVGFGRPYGVPARL